MGGASMTPLQMQMMIHYYARLTPYAEHEPDHANSLAVRDQRQQLVACGLLVQKTDETGWDGTSYCVTDKGRAYVNHLREVQIPVAVWVQP
jgi:hypothetical protein